MARLQMINKYIGIDFEIKKCVVRILKKGKSVKAMRSNWNLVKLERKTARKDFSIWVSLKET